MSRLEVILIFLIGMFAGIWLGSYIMIKADDKMVEQGIYRGLDKSYVCAEIVDE